MKPILENINTDGESSIKAFKYVATDFVTPWHVHPELELIYIVQSKGTKFIGDFVGDYEQGELVLLGGNLPHFWRNTHSDEDLCESIVIQWSSDAFAQRPELTKVFDLLKKANKGILFSKSTARKLKQDLMEILSLDKQEKYVRLLKVLIFLSKEKGSSLSQNSFDDLTVVNEQNRIVKIHNYVEKHFQERISLLQIANVVGMSEQSFSRFYSKLMGRPFFTYLNEYRINMATRMLVETDKTVSEIGYSCGYESLSFFYKQFKKVQNVTPYKYRKIHSNDQYLT
ncbi:AraC family transcriptional regulator [Flavicella marina]|uniref:AraC family transcriptional regulator n=1 Tax=Flavicella marina TaxID=1475951 RepID=UPI0012646817|nr:AraC family transcriptional regulator [Flavicella marina]